MAMWRFAKWRRRRRRTLQWIWYTECPHCASWAICHGIVLDGPILGALGSTVFLPLFRRFCWKVLKQPLHMWTTIRYASKAVEREIHAIEDSAFYCIVIRKFARLLNLADSCAIFFAVLILWDARMLCASQDKCACTIGDQVANGEASDKFKCGPDRSKRNTIMNTITNTDANFFPTNYTYGPFSLTWFTFTLRECIPSCAVRRAARAVLIRKVHNLKPIEKAGYTPWLAGASYTHHAQLLRTRNSTSCTQSNRCWI